MDKNFILGTAEGEKFVKYCNNVGILGVDLFLKIIDDVSHLCFSDVFLSFYSILFVASLSSQFTKVCFI